MSALETQVGGNHYKDMTIQPVEFIIANGIGYVEGAVIKYVCRWKEKGGVEDLMKARHFLDILIEAEEVHRMPPLNVHWDGMDSKYRWAAVGAYGDIVAYTSRPSLFSTEWKNDDMFNSYYIGYTDPAKLDWTKTLTERP